MSTRAITLTPKWQQITSRGQYGFIQTISGIAYLCVSETPPAEDEPAHPRTGDINYGDVVIWGRSTGDPTLIVVSGTE